MSALLTCRVQASLALALEEPEGLDVSLPSETGLPYNETAFYEFNLRDNISVDVEQYN